MTNFVGPVRSNQVQCVRYDGNILANVGTYPQAYLDLGGICTNTDAILESVAACGVTSGVLSPKVAVQFEASATAGTPAELRMTWDNGGVDPLEDTIIEATADPAVAGVLGNQWQIIRLCNPTFGGALVIEDAVNLVVYIFGQSGVTTIAQIEAAIAGATYIQVQQASSLAAPTTCELADTDLPAYLSGGESQEWLTETGSDAEGYLVKIHYLSGTSTDLMVETMIGTDATLIQVGTASTLGNILVAANDDFGPTDLNDIKATSVGSECVCFRLGVGVYGVGMPNGNIDIMNARATLQLAAPAGEHVITTLITLPNLVVFTIVNNAGAAADLAAGDSLHFTIFGRRSN